MEYVNFCFFFFSSRRRHTRFSRDWSSDVCSSDLELKQLRVQQVLSSAGELADKGTDVNGVTLVAEQVADGVDGSALRALASEVRNRLGFRPAVVALFSPNDSKGNFVGGAYEAGQDKG